MARRIPDWVANKISILSPILIAAGYVTFSSSNGFRAKNAGRILFGLGLMLLALQLISTATVPLRDASLFHMALSTVARGTGTRADCRRTRHLGQLFDTRHGAPHHVVRRGRKSRACWRRGAHSGDQPGAACPPSRQRLDNRPMPAACQWPILPAGRHSRSPRPLCRVNHQRRGGGVGDGVAAVAASHIAFNLVLVLTAPLLAGPIMKAMYRLMPAPKTLKIRWPRLATLMTPHWFRPHRRSSTRRLKRHG